MRTTISLFFLALLALAAWPLGARTAYAHGGQYRGPGGALPPNLRPPTDPTPPSPPPPTGAPPVTEPSSPGPTPGPAGPITPGGEQPPTTGDDPITGGAGTPRGGRATITADSWMFWYEHNKDALQQLKEGIYRFSRSGNVFGSMSGVRAGPRNASRHETRVLVQSQIIPTLLWVMDPANSRHQDTESAAYIALGKVSSDPQHIELLERGLQSKNGVTQEAAALALGLLRRERPDDQFDAASLDRVRAFLFGVFEDDKLPARLRGFAALSMGLLGDQPTAPEGGAARTAAKLFQLLEQRYEHNDLPVSLLLAVGLQPRSALTPAHYETLRTCVQKERLGRNDVQPYVASYAALALGRIGDHEADVLALLRVVGSRRTSDHVLRSATIALGRLGQRCDAESRQAIASALVDGLEHRRLRDSTARNFAVISLAYLLEAEVRSGSTEVLEAEHAGKTLLKLAEDGGANVRAYGALALGLACRAIGQDVRIEAYGEFQSEARRVLRQGLVSKRFDKRDRGAYAVALGLCQDEPSVGDLVKLVSDDTEDDELRSYAAIGLGHVGNNPANVLQALRRALASRRSEQLRRATAAALGMLTDSAAVPQLLDELKRVRSQNATGQVVIALAKVGDERAIAPLIALVRDVDQQELTRALACAGLGVVGDLAWIPSLSLISRDINYRAQGDLVREVLSII